MVLSIICAVFTAFITLVLLWRILQSSGAKLPKTLEEKYTPLGADASVTGTACAEIFVYALLFRLAVILAGGIIYGIFSAGNAKLGVNQFIDVWRKWDARHYMSIAENGYSGYTENGDYTTLVFFPLYPFLMKLLHFVIPNIRLCGITVSSVMYAFSCVYMYKLMLIDYPRETAQKSVVFMSIFPFSFFFGAIMSESVFLFTSVLTLYFTRKHNWLAAGIAGFAASLSRSAGVFLIIPATAELMEHYRLLEKLKNPKALLRVIFTKWAWLLLLPLGICVYLFINYKTAGNPFEFLRLEDKYWYQHSQPFFTTIGKLPVFIKERLNSQNVALGSFVPGLAAVIITYVFLTLGLREHRTMYLAWILVSLIINTSMSWPLSIARYMSCCFPLYAVIADKCVKNKRLDIAVTAVSVIAFGVYLTAYLTEHQVM